jgi:hypothetical protein
MAVNPNPSKLDQTQIFQRAFDEGEERLRVDAEISASIGTIEIAIDAAAGDNIAISDGTDQLEVNSDGSINVVAKIPGTTTQIETVSSTVTYIGDATPGTATSAASWTIIKIEKSGSFTSVKYANGQDSFNNIWDSRASYTYS